MGTDELSGKPDEMLGGNNLVMEWHPNQGGSNDTPSFFNIKETWISFD